MQAPWMDEMTAVTATAGSADVLPRRIPGQALEEFEHDPTPIFDDALTRFRGVARVGELWDPLSPETVLEVTASPVEYITLLGRIRECLLSLQG